MGDSMSDLKTLKDINWTDYTVENGEDLSGKFTDIIKQEAIKWVKDMSNHPLFVGMEDSRDGCITWIKHFFNISEEDLE